MDSPSQAHLFLGMAAPPARGGSSASLPLPPRLVRHPPRITRASGRRSACDAGGEQGVLVGYGDVGSSSDDAKFPLSAHLLPRWRHRRVGW